MPRFAANLSMLFTEYSLEDRFSAAAKAGFTAVELALPYALEAGHIQELLARNGLHLVLFNICAGNMEQGERGLACLPDRQNAFYEELERATVYVECLRPDCVHLMAGYAPEGVAEDTLERVFIDNVRHAAQRLAPFGTCVNIEAINQVSMPGFFLSTQARSADFVKRVGEKNVAMQFDCFHCQMQEGNVATRLEQYLPCIRHIQIAGAPERHEPDSGELCYDSLFALLDTLPYAGYVGCEYIPAGGTLEGLGWMRRWNR